MFVFFMRLGQRRVQEFPAPRQAQGAGDDCIFLWISDRVVFTDFSLDAVHYSWARQNYRVATAQDMKFCTLLPSRTTTPSTSQAQPHDTMPFTIQSSGSLPSVGRAGEGGGP